MKKFFSFLFTTMFVVIVAQWTIVPLILMLFPSIASAFFAPSALTIVAFSYLAPIVVLLVLVTLASTTNIDLED